MNLLKEPEEISRFHQNERIAPDRVLVAGLGSMGKRRIRLLQRLKPGVPIAGTDSREDRRITAEKEFAIPAFASLEEAFNHFSPTILFACTPPLSHADIVLYGLNNGCHTFSEMNLDSSRYPEILSLAEEKRRTAFLSSSMLYRDEIEYIQKMIESPERFTYTYHVGQYLPDWHPWERIQDFFVSDPRTNACRELFAIELPWISSVFGKIASCHIARRKITHLEIAYPDVYACVIEHEVGCCGVLLIDVVSRIPQRSLHIVGENSDITWEGTPESLRFFDANKRTDSTPLRNDDAILHNPQYASIISEVSYIKELTAFFAVVNGASVSSDFYGYSNDAIILDLIDRIERD